MYYRYLPYQYYRRYYNINPYFYRRYYPYYNLIDSQYGSINQDIVNYGNMSDVIQDADIYQSMSPETNSETIVSEPASTKNSEVTIEHSNIISIHKGEII